MVKKLHKSAEAAAPEGKPEPGRAHGNPLAQAVKESAQQIWLAGLGAFSKAQGGGKLFETLMKEGVSLQRKTQAAAEEKIGDVADKMSAMAGEVGHKANAQWDKLETIFEERTARALGRLGVPSAKELAALAARVDALSAALAQLGGSADKPAGKPRFRPGKALKAAAEPTQATGKAATVRSATRASTKASTRPPTKVPPKASSPTTPSAPTSAPTTSPKPSPTPAPTAAPTAVAIPAVKRAARKRAASA